MGSDHCPLHDVLHAGVKEDVEYLNNLVTSLSRNESERGKVCATNTTRLDYMEDKVDTLHGSVEALKAGHNKLIGVLLFAQLIIAPLATGLVLLAAKKLWGG